MENTINEVVKAEVLDILGVLNVAGATETRRTIVHNGLIIKGVLKSFGTGTQLDKAIEELELEGKVVVRRKITGSKATYLKLK